MIVEIAAVLAMLVGGSALVRIGGMRGWGVPVLGAVTGISLYIVVGLVLLVLPVPTHPALTIALTGGTPLAVWFWMLLRRRDVVVHRWWALLVGLGAIGAVVMFRSLRLTNWTYDSIQYLLNGALLANDHFDEASTGLVPKRLIGVPLLHAAGDINGELYLPSMSPLIAGLILALIAWLGWTAVSRHCTRWIAAVIVVGGLLLVVSLNRFIFHAFYVNGHLLFGLLLLGLVGCGWLVAVEDRDDKPALLLVVGLAAVALVVVRAEGCIVVGLAILPIILDHTTSVRFKALLLASVGSCVVAWQWFVAIAYLDDGLSVPISVLGLVFVGVAMLLAIPVLRWQMLSRHRRVLLWAVELTLWLALAIAFARKPDILIDSFSATVQNTIFGTGSWGLSLLILLTMTTVALWIQVPESTRLRFSLTTFVPFAFLLAYLREAAYRVGEGDSLNRMWIQLVPLAVLYIIIAIGAPPRRPLTRVEASPAFQSPPL